MRPKALIVEVEASFDERQEQAGEGHAPTGPHLLLTLPVRVEEMGGGSLVCEWTWLLHRFSIILSMCVNRFNGVNCILVVVTLIVV